MKFRDLKTLAQDCTASKRYRWELNPSSRFLEPSRSIDTQPCSAQPRFIHIITSSALLFWGSLAPLFFFTGAVCNQIAHQENPSVCPILGPCRFFFPSLLLKGLISDLMKTFVIDNQMLICCKGQCLIC